MKKYIGVKKRGEVWYIRYTDASGRRRNEPVHQARSAKEAYRLRCERLAERRAEPVARPARRIRLSAWLDEYRRDYVPVDTHPNWKATIRRGCARANEHFETDPYIDEIDKEDVLKFSLFLKKQYTNPSTVKHYFGVIRRALEVACVVDLIASNPADTKKLPADTVPAAKRGETRYLSPEEARRLLAAARTLRPTAMGGGPHPFLPQLIVVALRTGARRGELLKLTWDKVDFPARWAHFESRKGGRTVERPVPLSSDAVEALMSLPRESRFVFSYLGEPVKSIATAWGKARRIAGLDDVNFHALRHTYASLRVQDGASLPEIQAILGHSTPMMTQRYAHLDPRHFQASASKLDGLFEVKSADEGTA